MKYILTFTGAVATLALASAAQAAAPVVDGVISSGEYAGAISSYVGYNPASPTDFSAYTSTSELSPYTVYYEGGSAGVNIAIQGDPLGAGLDKHDATVGLNFANLYFSTTGCCGSNIGFEIENNRAFVPGVPGYFAGDAAAGITYAATNGTTYADGGAGNVFEAFIPWSVFENDPLGTGVTPLKPGGQLQLRVVQASGYAGVGGPTSDARFGVLTAPGVPEPASWALMIGGFGMAGAALRRRRYQAAR